MTPLSCLTQSRCNSSAFRSPVLLHLLLYLDTYGGVDPLGVFPLFLTMVADIIAPKCSLFLCGLIRRGSFAECWRSANVSAIPKGAPSDDRENYRPISITPILSKVNEKLVSRKLSSFCEKCGVLPAAQFAYRKGLGFTANRCHHFQLSLDRRWSRLLFSLPLVLPSIE